MAGDKKLSELEELATTPAVDDQLYIRDVSEVPALESKRISVTNLMAAVVWGDVRLKDFECPVCLRVFKEGDRLVFTVNKIEEKFITAVPIHLACAGGQ